MGDDVAAAAPAPPTAALPLPPATPTLVAPPEWRAIDFISDLHLAATAPRAFDAWAAYMRHTPASAVFILGDLFDMWVGDDSARRGFEARCAAVLAETADRIPVGFMIGNRDFLVGEALQRQTGIFPIADPTVVVAFGGRVVVTHGDALCVDDEAYQRYRRVVNRDDLQRAFFWLPLFMRRAIGFALRRNSRSHRGDPRPVIGDVDPASVERWLHEAGATSMVHGHTHLPLSHPLPSGARHVLSDWALDGTDPPRLEVLRWDAEGFQRLAPEGHA